MSIVVYSTLFLPRLVLEGGIRGKQRRSNERVSMSSGHAAVNMRWTQTLREYEVGFAPMRRIAWQALETIHEITGGGAFGFLLEDPKDSTVLTTATAWGMVTALTSTTFQLHRRLKDVASSLYHDRKITRPKGQNTLKVYISGILQTHGVDWTGDITTGIITIPSAPSASDVTWEGPFYVPVHFMDDTLEWVCVVPGEDPNSRFIAGPSAMLQEIRE